MRLQRSPDGATRLLISVWGAPIAGVVERLRARVPALAQAAIQVHPLEGRVRTSLGGLLARKLLHSENEAELEAARRELRQALRDEGQRGEPSVHIEDSPDGHRRVRIELRDETPAPATDAPR